MFVLRALSTAAGVSAAILFAAPTALADPTTSPVAEGDFTSTTDPGWVFFVPQGFGGAGCGIGPDGTVGCDIVPGRWPDGTPIQEGQPGPPGFYSCENHRCPLPPPGANQTVANAQKPAEYVQSAAKTFTRAVDMLPTGYRLVNGSAWCALSPQGTIQCVSGDNGFFLNATYGLLDVS